MEEIRTLLEVEGRGLHNGNTGLLRGQLAGKDGETVYCDCIQISIPVGNASGDLFLDDGGTVIESETASWNQLLEQKRMSVEGKVSLEIRSQGGMQRPLSEPIAFVVLGRVNMQPGTVQVEYEYHYKLGKSGEAQTAKETFIFEKTRAELYLQNFLAADTESGMQAKTCFTPGTPIYFSWEGNATAYELSLSTPEGVTPLIQTQEKHYTYEVGINKDSTFLLRAVKTTNALAKKMGASGSGELYAALTLTTDAVSLQGLTVGNTAQKAVKNEWNCTEAYVNMLGTAEELPIPQMPNYCKITPETDGILVGMLNVTRAAEVSTAVIRIAIYGDQQEEECVVQDQAYSAVMPVGNEKLEFEKGASVMLPIAKGKKAVLYWSMTKPEQGELLKNYDIRWYFFPFGKGTVKII